MTNHDLDDRLARLAPPATPDPARLAAARATVERTIADPARTVDAPAATEDAQSTGSPANFSVDVVTRIDPARRRRRGTLLATAATGVVVAAVATVLLLPDQHLPGPAGSSASEAAAIAQCREQIDTGALPDSSAAYPVATAEEHDDTTTVFLAAATRPDAVVLCDVDDTEEIPPGLVGMSGVMTSPVPDSAISHAGGGGGGAGDWSSSWGYVGADVEGVTVTTSRGTTAEAELVDGYWVAWWLSQTDSEQVTELTWSLRDGSARSATADELSDAAEARDAAQLEERSAS